MNRFLPSLFLLIGLGTTIMLAGNIHTIRARHTSETMSSLGHVPASLLRATALEFHGIIADFMLLKTITYVGMRLQENSQPTPEEWKKTATMLRGVTDLDPRFWDPYLFAEMMFVWQANMLEEANALLTKAAEHLPNDFRPSYFLGFNAFYFERNIEKAAPYLRRAASLPGAPDFIKGLAARFSVYSNQTKFGIIFLSDLLRSTKDPKTAAYLKKRLDTLKMLGFLEKKAKEFEEKTGRLPVHLDELVEKGHINTIPKDSYGGTFKIFPNGRIYTSSNMIDQ